MNALGHIDKDFGMSWTWVWTHNLSVSVWTLCYKQLKKPLGWEVKLQENNVVQLPFEK